jgi:hypothetical protein
LQAPTAEAHDSLRLHLGLLLATLYPDSRVEVNHILDPKSRLTNMLYPLEHCKNAE